MVQRGRPWEKFPSEVIIVYGGHTRSDTLDLTSIPKSTYSGIRERSPLEVTIKHLLHFISTQKRVGIMIISIMIHLIRKGSIWTSSKKLRSYIILPDTTFSLS